MRFKITSHSQQPVLTGQPRVGKDVFKRQAEDRHDKIETVLLLIAACLPDLGPGSTGGPLWSNPDALDDDSVDTAAVGTDADGDGFYLEEDDCNDADAQTHPGAEDFCDGRDQDCDEEVDEDAAGDVYEPNDQNASALGPVTNSSLTIEAWLTDEGDLDRYSFSHDDSWYLGPEMEFHLDDLAANSDYALRLLGPGGDVLAEANDKAGGKAETLTWSGEAWNNDSGTYTIEVFSVAGADCSREYTLEVTER